MNLTVELVVGCSLTFAVLTISILLPGGTPTGAGVGVGEGKGVPVGVGVGVGVDVGVGVGVGIGIGPFKCANN